MMFLMSGKLPSYVTSESLEHSGSSQEEVNKVDRYAEEIGTIQTLRNSFGPILNVVLLALDAPAVFMRTKALRALGQIVNSDSSILAAVRERVRRAGTY
jgi:cohesin loading factor subunit SCC2